MFFPPQRENRLKNGFPSTVGRLRKKSAHGSPSPSKKKSPIPARREHFTLNGRGDLPPLHMKINEPNEKGVHMGNENTLASRVADSAAGVRSFRDAISGTFAEAGWTPVGAARSEEHI